MKLNVNQFDDGGGSDYAPANPAPAAAPAMEDSDARKVATSVNTNTAEGIAAASATPPTGPSPLAMTSGMSSGYKEPGKGAGMKTAKAPKAIDKSAWDKGTKVSQKMVDYVKSEGRGNMGSVPQGKVKNGAPGYNGSTFDKNAPVGAEYKEAVKRIYPNGAPASKSSSKSSDKPAVGFNASSPGAKAFPKVAAPKTNSAKVTEARNKEITEANKQGAVTEQIAASVTNAFKAYPSLVGLSGKTPTNYQIEGTKTKTQKAQAAAKAERAKAVAKNKNK
jgi:hypothetical protein